MADLAPARAAGSPRFAHAERREVVVQNEPLRLFAAAVSVQHLRFFDRRQSGQGECLRFAALENGRAMRARQHAHFAGDRAQLLITATVHAFLFVQNADAKRFFLHVIECLRDREGIGLGVLFQDRALYFFAQAVDRFRSDYFPFGVKRAFNAVASHLVSDLKQLWLDLQKRHFAFRFSDLRGQFLLNANHLARAPVRELERFDEIGFGQLIRCAFDHDHVVFSPDVNQIEIALPPL